MGKYHMVLGVAVMSTLTSHASATYVTIGGTGYNVDVVVQAGETAGAAGRFLNEGQALYETGSHGAITSGLPVGGWLTSLYDGTPFQLAPYNGLNAIIVDEDGGSAAGKFQTFTFDAASQQAYNKISLLGLGAGGQCNFSAVLFFTDGTHTGLGYDFEGRNDVRGAFDGKTWSDWFNNDGNNNNSPPAHQASSLGLGRVDEGGGVSGDNSDGGVRLQQIDLDLAGWDLVHGTSFATKIVDHIEFEATGGDGKNRTVLALTGESNTAVPEPASLALVAISGMGLMMRRRSR